MWEAHKGYLLQILETKLSRPGVDKLFKNPFKNEEKHKKEMISAKNEFRFQYFGILIAVYYHSFAHSFTHSPKLYCLYLIKYKQETKKIPDLFNLVCLPSYYLSVRRQKFLKDIC